MTPARSFIRVIYIIIISKFTHLCVIDYILSDAVGIAGTAIKLNAGLRPMGRTRAREVLTRYFSHYSSSYGLRKELENDRGSRSN